MQDQYKTKAALISELEAMRACVARLKQVRNPDQLAMTAAVEFRLDGSLPSWVYDTETLALLEVNAAALGLYGYSRAEFLKLNLTDLYPPEAVSTLIERFSVLRSQQRDGVLRAQHVKKNGARIDVDMIVHPMFFQGRATYRAFIQNITTYQLTARTLAEQQQVFAQLSSGAPLESTLQLIIHNVELQIEGAIGSIQLLDDDGVHLHHVAAASLPSDYVAAVDGHAIGPNVGSCGTAAFLRQPVIVTDIASDPRWVNFRRFALMHGLHSCWSIPFFDSHQQLLGTFAIYHHEPCAPTLSNQAELKHAADIAAVAVEAKRTEAALRDSEQRYRGLADAIPLMIWTALPSGQRNYFNRRCADYFGSAYDLLGNQDWSTVINPDDLRNLQDSRQAALANGTAYVLECRLRRYDGEYRWHTLHELPIYNGAGDITFWVGTAADIHEQRWNQQALLESEIRYRLVSQATNDVIWDWDILNDRIEWNEGLLTTFGYYVDEVEASASWWNQLLHPEDYPQVYESFTAALQSNDQFWTYEYRVQRADGSYAYVLDRAYVIRDSSGVPLRMIGAIQDITERTRAEAEVRRLNSDLEQRVIERTAQIEAANKELEAFSYSVSHDLRAPLRHIDGFARLLAQREGARLDETSSRYLRVISDAARKMGQLIDDLLSFSRMSRAEMQLLPVDLNLVITHARQELAPMCEGRTIIWRVDTLPIVQGDPAMLQLVFVNLLSNAIKYTAPRAEAQIAIYSTISKKQVEIAVRDNGVGFDMQYVHKLFGVFQRLHRDEEFEGTGIGLATVQRIIHRHGGRIWAEGVLDQGAVFHIALKRHRSDDANEKNPTSGR